MPSQRYSRIHLMAMTIILLLACFLFGPSIEAADFAVPILLYHRFAPHPTNPYTISPQEFEAHMLYLKEKGYRVIPLESLVNYYLGKGSLPPPRSVVITLDDGHASIYTYAWPILKKYGYPATLFVYPCWITRVNYALTWEQIRGMAASGLEIASHTYYHPNFKVERRRLGASAYEALVAKEFTSSKKVLEEKVGRQVLYLSYPFGIHDEVLERKGFEAGYQAMFTIVRQPCGPSSNRGALGRYLITPRMSLSALASILSAQGDHRTHHANARPPHP